MSKALGNSKQLIILADYKEGFNELVQLVQGFEEMSPKSQELYMTYVKESLEEQLQLIDHKKTEVLAEVRQFLAQYNSQFKALSDTEKHLREQIAHYEQIGTVITNDDDGQQTEERAAV